MTKYIIRRLLLMVPVLLGISLLNFSLYLNAPGDPVSIMLNPLLMQEAGGGVGQARVTEEMIEAAKERLGLNDPWTVQYVRWLSNVLRGDFGNSFINPEPVSDVIGRALWPTLQINLVALLLSTIIGLSIGILQAVFQYSWFDYIASFVSFFYISMPGFFLALLAIFIFAIKLGWLPAAGYQTVGIEPTFQDHLRYMILPTMVLALGGAPGLMRYTRTAMLEVIHQPYITTGHAKGLRPRTVMMRHAFRNTLIPVLTTLGSRLPLLISGSVIVEQIFDWPGMGQASLRATFGRDYPVLMGLIIMSSLITLIAILITDVAYTLVDPRIRLD
ncbi:MAG: ABC transporter permease [Anaerolineae bacterium]|nr:ABC transporter permease [Anaerolineae bacterium]